MVCLLPLLLLTTSASALYATSDFHKRDKAPPKNFGVVLFRAMEIQDMWAPLDPLQIWAHNAQMNLFLLAETLDPVTSEPAAAGMNPFNSSFWPTVQPSHTFASNPALDVLIVPGGPGVRMADPTVITDYIARTYPTLQYLITICTGAGLAAKAGVLDGRFATTNKRAWATITAMGPNVKWTAPARYVVDGNVWSSSGVTAGIDLVHAFITEVWSKENSTFLQGLTEYKPNGQCYDPFSAEFNVGAQYHLPNCP